MHMIYPVPPVSSAANFSPPLLEQRHVRLLPRHHYPKTDSKTQLSIRNDALVSLLSSCQSIHDFPPIHAHLVKRGRHHDARLLFKVLRLCAQWDAIAYAEHIFESIPVRDVYHYTAFIGGLVSARLYHDAIRLFLRMLTEHVFPDAFVLSHVLRACGFHMALDEGRQVHAQLVKLDCGSNRPVALRLVEFYARCGEFGDARKVFGGMPEKDAVVATILISCFSDRGLLELAYTLFVGVEDKDTVCWTAMIDGFVRNGRMNDALMLFREMQKENVKPNEVTIVCVLCACSQLGALDLGRWIHFYLDSYEIKLNNYVSSTLIDMYLRCASVDDAWSVFEAMPHRDLVSYNAMITGLAFNGESNEAIRLFKQMIKHGLSPNPVTFVGVLNACSHGGMVDLGYEIFHDMSKTYGVEPQIEHYGCMVDLLGRVGHLQAAYDLIQSMRVEPDHIIWGSLLGACKIHGNLVMAAEIARILIGQEAADSGTYVLLSNVYASFGNWEEAAWIRSEMRKRGIQKEPGCSSIEVNNEIHEFLLGDIRHPERDKIYKKLEEMNGILKLEGHSPACEVVLQDIGEDEKEWALAIHSERLAICYGLISTEPGSTIRVVKNLRVCNDCHSMIKLIAKVTRRKIVVRDRKRFHHFENGSCSCGDYW